MTALIKNDTFVTLFNGLQTLDIMNDLINNRLFDLRIQSDTNLVSLERILSISYKRFGIDTQSEYNLLCLERILSIVYPSKYNQVKCIRITKQPTIKKKIFYVDRLPLRHTKKEYITIKFKFMTSANLSFDFEVFKTGTEAQQRAEFSRIYVHYRPIIMNYIMFQIGRDKIQVTEELTNNILLNISNNVINYNNDIAQFKTYVFTYVKNELIDYYRSGSRKKLTKTALIGDYVNDSGVSSFDVVAPKDINTIFRTETMNKIMASIEKLKDNERKVVEHIVLDDLSQAEVAEKMNISVNNVKQIYFRAKKELQIMLKRDYEMAWGF